MIVLEDPREIEDILVRRNKEFDKSSTAIDTMGPIFPLGTLSQRTTPELKAQKRLWADVMSNDFLHTAVAPQDSQGHAGDGRALETQGIYNTQGPTIQRL